MSIFNSWGDSPHDRTINQFGLRTYGVLFLLAALTANILSGCAIIPAGLDISASSNIGEFNGQRALRDVEYQVSLGPRIPGSSAHEKTVDWIRGELDQAGWRVEVWETIYKGQRVQNVIGSYGSGLPWVIVGAHYDSRLISDQDPVTDFRSTPVPGANDGASGVAVLLELARVLTVDRDEDAGQIGLVFFDAEDNGGIPGWEWIMGSNAFVAELDGDPDAVVIVDMIGDADLNIYKEGYSDPGLTDEIWSQAAELGYDAYFIEQYGYHMLDDHKPFLDAGIPTVLLIDFDYPYWHTLEDTPDKVSAKSLQIVGKTVQTWLRSYNR
jgi:hypothetical protein